MTSNLTVEVVEIESPKIDSQKINSTEPNYCSGSSYQNLSYTVAQISAAMAGTVTLSAISAYLVGLLSASAGFSVSYSAVRTAASAVFLSITSGDFNKRVSFRINFTCSRMWESDPFHPSGGFYFYGWRLSNVTYLGLY